MVTAKADLSFLGQPALVVAPRLLGWRLSHQSPEGQTGGIIVEAEAYMGTSDPASHGYRGPTERTAVMFGPPGQAYIYFTYGRHFCMNVVTGTDGECNAVLMRALEPTTGLELMKARRKVAALTELTTGPAKLAQALGLTKAQNGADLLTSPLRLTPGVSVSPEAIVTSPRIGISRAADRLWRFSIKDNPYVSRPKPQATI